MNYYTLHETRRVANHFLVHLTMMVSIGNNTLFINNISILQACQLTIYEWLWKG